MKSIEKFTQSLEVLLFNVENEAIHSLTAKRDIIEKIIILREFPSKEEVNKELLESERRKRKVLIILDILRILKINPSNWDMCGEVFIEFDLLSELMLETKLNMKEQADVIEYFISKNLASGVTKVESNYFDIRKLSNFEFENITYEQAKLYLKTDGYRKLSEKENKTEQEKMILNELENFIDQNTEKHDDITRIHKIIEEEYLNHKENLTEANVTSYIEQLKKLNLSEEVANSLKLFLMKKIKKEKPIMRLKPMETLKEEPTLSKKQYYELESRLKEVLDLDTMEFKKQVSNTELKELFDIMIQLKYDKEIIYKVARKYEKMNQQKNAIVLYLEMVDQLRDYVDEETIHNLEEIFNETFICSREDYIEWKNILKENLLEQMPKDYTLKLMK